MRLAIYTDYVYRRDDDGVSGERAFVSFMVGLRPLVDDLRLVGRLDPEPGRGHYALPGDVGFVALPWYDRLTNPARVIASLWGSAVVFWRMLDEVDTVWLLGPYVHAIGFAALARLRRRHVVLGVRQDFPRYVRSRHPRSRWVHRAADVLEAVFRRMARRMPVVVVGPDLARSYSGACAVLELAVSLVSEAQIVDPDVALQRPWGAPVRVLSVGRLDREKNPLLLADVLGALITAGHDTQLIVAGAGPMREALEERLAGNGVARAAQLVGYVANDGGLMELYRSADVFLHVSFTEGLPQVLFEAFAAGLPVVATDVGGVAEAAGDAALLIGPDDAAAAVEAVIRLGADPALRERLVRAGTIRVRARTIERESAKLIAFLSQAR